MATMALTPGSYNRLKRKFDQYEATTGRTVTPSVMRSLMEAELKTSAGRAAADKQVELQSQQLSQNQQRIDLATRRLDEEAAAAKASGKTQLLGTAVQGGMLLKDTKLGKAVTKKAAGLFGDKTEPSRESILRGFTPKPPSGGAAAITAPTRSSLLQGSSFGATGAMPTRASLLEGSKYAGIAGGGAATGAAAQLATTSAATTVPIGSSVGVTQTAAGATVGPGAATPAVGGTVGGGIGAALSVAGPAAIAGGLAGLPFDDRGAKRAAGALGGAIIGGVVAAGTSFGASIVGGSLAGGPVGAVVGAVVGLISSGGTVVCSELYKQGYITGTELMYDHQYRVKYIDDDTYEGYLTWGIPLAEKMRKSKTVTQLVKPLGVAWAKEMASRMDKSRKGSFLGKCIITIGVPICRVIGKEKKRWVSLKTQDVQAL